ncbi:cerberus-like [Arapaima gigas]
MVHWWLTVVLMSAVNSGAWGRDSPHPHIASQLGELRRRADFGHGPVPVDLARSSSPEHLQNILEELRNWNWSRSTEERKPPEASFRAARPTAASHAGDPAQAPSFKNARKFWNDFAFSRRSDFQSIVPIKNKQVQQHSCHTVPFQQKVSHEACETVVLQNNLCFGQCGSSDGARALCSRCSPVKAARRTVELQCAGDTRVARVVTVVEECQCDIRRGRHCVQNGGPVLVDPSLPGNLV